MSNINKQNQNQEMLEGGTEMDKKTIIPDGFSLVATRQMLSKKIEMLFSFFAFLGIILSAASSEMHELNRHIMVFFGKEYIPYSTKTSNLILFLLDDMIMLLLSYLYQLPHEFIHFIAIRNYAKINKIPIWIHIFTLRPHVAIDKPIIKSALMRSLLMPYCVSVLADSLLLLFGLSSIGFIALLLIVTALSGGDICQSIEIGLKVKSSEYIHGPYILVRE